jgi:hypothetical protein
LQKKEEPGKNGFQFAVDGYSDYFALPIVNEELNGDGPIILSLPEIGKSRYAATVSTQPTLC